MQMLRILIVVIIIITPSGGPATGFITRATRARFPNLPAGIEASCGYGCMISGGSASWTAPNPNKYGPVKYYTDNITAHDRMDTTGTWFQVRQRNTRLLPAARPVHSFRSFVSSRSIT